MSQLNSMVCFTYGVFDLIHYGHLIALKRAKLFGDKLIIGVFTDRVAEGFKRKPIMTQEERFRNIKELDFGEVVYLDDLTPTQEYLNALGVNTVAKADGAGWSGEFIPSWTNISSVRLPYTKGISTSEIINRIKQ